MQSMPKILVVTGAWLLLVLAAPKVWSATPEQLLHEALFLVQREHVDAEHLAPTMLLEGALAGAAATFPDFNYNLQKSNARMELRVRVGNRLFSDGGEPPQSIVDLHRVLVRVHRFMLEELHPYTDGQKIVESILNGLLSSADPWSALLSPGEYVHFQRVLASRYGGVGLRVARKRGVLGVVSVMAGSAAEKAGVLPGDRITRINMEPASGLSEGQVMARLLGEPGQAVQLYYRRGDQLRVKMARLVRREIHVPSVESHLLQVGSEKWVGYLRISEFLHTTGSELASSLARFFPERPGFLGLILDLRGNPGGVVEESIRATDRFLNRGMIARLVRNQGRVEQIQARGSGPLTRTPMVALVDDGSASGAELMAGALRNNRRAVVIGSSSVGKNSVQSIIPISGGLAVRLTTARFLLPGKGAEARPHLQPDLLMIPAGVDPGGRAFGLAPRNPLDNGKQKQTLALLQYHDPRPWVLRTTLGGAANGEKALGERLAGDFLVGFAKQMLVSNNKRGFDALVRVALETRSVEQHQQQRKLVTALSHFKKNWEPTRSQEGGRALIEAFSLQTRSEDDPAGGWKTVAGPLGPGGRLKLTLTAVNRGRRATMPLVGVVYSESPLFAGLEFPIGQLSPRERGSWSIELVLPPEMDDGQEHLALELRDTQSQVHQKASLLVSIRAQPRPRVRVGVVAAAKGNQRGLRIQVENMGHRRLSGGSVMVQPVGFGGVMVPDENQWSEARLPAIAPGEAGEVRLNLPPAGKEQERLPLLVQILDGGTHALWYREKTLSFSEIQSGGRQVLDSPVIELQVEPRSVTTTGLALSGTVRDDRFARMLRIRLNGVPVLYQVHDYPRAGLDFQSRLELREGRNVLELEAWDDQRLGASQRIVLWRGNRHEVAGAGGVLKSW